MRSLITEGEDLGKISNYFPSTKPPQAGTKGGRMKTLRRSRKGGETFRVRPSDDLWVGLVRVRAGRRSIGR